jgi:hypothetical protein
MADQRCAGEGAVMPEDTGAPDEAEARRRPCGAVGATAAGFDADALLAQLGVWASEERSAQAAADRSRQRWLRQQAGESATWLGLLVDLAERQVDLAVALRSGGRTLHGRVTGVAKDFCVVADRTASTIIALAHVATVRCPPPSDRRIEDVPATGDRPAPLAMTLGDVLDALSGARAVVRIGLVGADPLRGVLVGAGVDMASLRPTGSDLLVHIASAAIETVTPVR